MIKEDKKQEPSNLLSLREKVLKFKGLIPSWEEIKKSETVRNNAKKAALFVAVLFIFNLALYILLSPRTVDSRYTGFYTDEFVKFNEEDWFDIEGDWDVNDGRLYQNSFVAVNPALMLSLQAQPENTVYFSADVEIGNRGDGAGIRFNMWSPEQIARSHRVAITRQEDEAFLTGGYYADSLDFIPQFKLPLGGPFQENSHATITVISDQESYDVYLNNELVVLDVPAMYPPGWHGLSAAGNTVAFDRMEIDIEGSSNSPSQGNVASKIFNRSTEDEEIDLDEPVSIPIEGKDLILASSTQPEESGWLPYNGIWSARNGSLIQSMWQQVDARAVYESPFKSYRLEIDLWHPQTPGGGGVIFGMESVDSLANAYLMRFSDDGSGFFLGRYDDKGLFDGMEFMPLDMVGTKVQTLGIINSGSQFEISLNGEPIFKKLPHDGEPSYFGLVSNQTEVAYERIFITPYNRPKTVDIIETDGDEDEDSKGQETNADEAKSSETAPSNADDSKTVEEQSAPSSSFTLSDELNNITGEPFFQSTFLGSLGDTKWIPFRGDWSISDGALLQTNKEGFDFAIGYNEPYENYVLRSQFRHIEGQGGGVLFGMTRPDSRNRSHVVRYDSGQNAILFGHFDENGQFIAQGGEAVGAPLDRIHQLDIVKNSESYDIYVDGLKLIGDIPLISNGPHIGLTSSTSIVKFESVEVFPLNPADPNSQEEAAATNITPPTATPAPTSTPEAAAGSSNQTDQTNSDDETDEAPLEETPTAETEQPTSPPAVDEPEPTDQADASGDASIEEEQEEGTAESTFFNAADLLFIAGDWAVEGSTVVQSSPDMFDQVLGLNQFGRQFELDVTLTMIDDPDISNVGGGIIFNAPNPDSKNEGQIVRFLNGGSEIIWGYFDENGRFNGQGGGGVGLLPGTKQTIGIRVNETTFDIVVNDTPVATDLELRSTEGGYLHLITFRGDVVFHEVEFTDTALATDE